MRILAVAPSLPYPADHGQRLRTWGFLSRLARRDDVDVTLLTWREAINSDADVAAVRAAIPDTVVLPVGDVDLSRSARIRRQARFVAGQAPPPYVQALLEERFVGRNGLGRGTIEGVVLARHRERPFDLVLLEDEGMTHVPLPDLGVPVVVHRLQVFSQVLWDLRRQSTAGRAAWKFEGRAWRRYDLHASARASLNIATTPESAASLRALVPEARVVAITNGVDFPPLRTPVSGGRDVAFIGWMGYPPNADAAVWFATDIWPGIRATHPSSTFRIVGREPSPEVLALHDPAGAGVEVTGEVASVGEACEGIRLGVAPLRAGMGIKNKVLELMSMGAPVVAAPPGAEGILAGRADGLIVAADVAATVTEVGALLDDGPRAAEIGAAARAFVQRHFGWDRLVEELHAELRRVVDGR